MSVFRLILVAGWAAFLAHAAASPAEEARQALRRGDTLQAYLLFLQASTADPGNAEWRLQAEALKPRALSQVRVTHAQPAERPASGEFLRAIADSELAEARQALPPPQLRGPEGVKSFDFRGEAEPVFQKLAALFGFEFLFEKDYQSPPPFRIQMQDVGWQEALRAVEVASNSFLVPLADRRALVVRDTPQKRGEYMPTMTVAIPVPTRVTVQEAQEILAGVQQTLEIRRIALDPQKRMIVLRDQVIKADAARKLISDLMLHRPQVALEVDLLFTGQTKQQTIGFTLPTSAVLMYLTDSADGLLTLPMAIDRVMKSSNYLMLGLTGAEFFANLTRTSATSLIKSQLVALDGLPSTIHIGDRYPIQTNVYIGDTGQGGEVFTPPPQITFEELGTLIKVTPTVHGMDEVTLEIEAEFKLLGSGSFNGIPVISSRKYQGRVRVKNGEVAVLGGLVDFARSKERTGLPWLSELPYIGILFRRDTTEEQKSDTLITVTPRVMSLPPGETAMRPLWIGSETHPVTVY